MNEFNENNPMFIAYVELLNALCEEGILQKNPSDEDIEKVPIKDRVEICKGRISECWYRG